MTQQQVDERANVVRWTDLELATLEWVDAVKADKRAIELRKSLAEQIDNIDSATEKRRLAIGAAWLELERTAMELSERANKPDDPRLNYDPKTDLHGQLYHKVFPKETK